MQRSELQFSLAKKGGRIMIMKHVATGMCAAVLMLGLSACAKKGPAEKAGEKVDQAAESVKDTGEKAKDKVEEKVDEAHDAVK
jgi:hyperosmotically inducible protein